MLKPVAALLLLSTAAVPTTSFGKSPTSHFVAVAAVRDQTAAQGMRMLSSLQPVPAAGGVLQSGVSQAFSIGPVENPTIFLGQNLYEFVVAPSHRRMEIRLTTATSGANVDCYLRRGQPPELVDGSVVADHSTDGYSGNEGITITGVSVPPLASGTYYIALVLHTTGVQASGTITVAVSGDDYPGRTLAPGIPQSFKLPLVQAPSLFLSAFSYRIEVPQDTTRLEVVVDTVNGASVDVDAHLRFGQEPALDDGTILADHSSEGPTGREVISIDATSDPPLRFGTYYLALSLYTPGVIAEGSIAVSITSSGGGSGPALEVSQSALSFETTAGVDPSPQVIRVRNSGGGTLAYTLSADRDWLRAAPAEGTSDGEWDEVSVSVDASGLTAEQHTAQLRVDAGSAGAFAVSVSVMVAAGPVVPPDDNRPVISANSIVNGADFTPVFSPGILISVFGEKLAAGTTLAQSTPLPTSLDGVSVEVRVGDQWVPLPLFFVSAGQINAQLLYGVSPGAVQLRVRTPSGTSETVSINVVERSPRLLTTSADGRGEAILLHADYTLVTPQNPAKPGEVVILYLTGLGPVSPTVEAGHRAGDGGDLGPLNLISPEVRVLVNGVSCSVYYAGLAPGWIGLYQVNFQVPEGAAPGSPNLTVEVTRQASQLSVGFACGQTWQVIASAAVGPQGGAFSGGGATLTIDQGTLGAENQISILTSPDPADPKPDLISEVYSITGLPDTTNGSMTFEAMATADVPEGDVFLLVSEGDNNSNEFLVAAHAEGRILRATLPARLGAAEETSAASQKSPAGPDRNAMSFVDRIRLAFTSGYRTRTEGHFHFTYPKRYAIDKLATGFTTAYDDLSIHGISSLNGVGKPISVFVMDTLFTTPPEPWGGMSFSGWSGSDGIRVMTALLDGPVSQIEPKAAHLLMHYAAGYYNPRERNIWQENFEWEWFEEAAATWFERASSDAMPQQALDQRTFLTRHGLEFAHERSYIDAVRHGYGASLLFEHLTAASGSTNWLATMLAAKKEPSYPGSRVSRTTPVEALENLLSGQQEQLEDRWLRFCDAYVMGDLYGTTGGYEEIEGWEDELRNQTAIQSEMRSGETVRKISASLQDLSAQFYNVKFTDEWRDENTDSTLSITLETSSEHVGLLLYGVLRDGTIEEFVGFVQDQQTARANNIGDRLARYQSLLIGLVNGRHHKPYDEYSRADVTIEVETPSELLALLAGAADAGDLYIGVELWVDPICTGSCFDKILIENKTGVSQPNKYFPVTVPGTEFISSGTFPRPTGECTASVSARLSTDGQLATVVKAARSCTWTNDGDSYQSEAKYTLENLPLRPDLNVEFLRYFFQVDGKAVNNHLKSLEYQVKRNGTEVSKITSMKWDGPEGWYFGKLIFEIDD